MYIIIYFFGYDDFTKTVKVENLMTNMEYLYITILSSLLLFVITMLI